ncbi:hypothetical protein VNO78_15971 [Psophocarpus tetragonolobus]|uniref:glucan endo-1,3-beta-D-glucosidase n=1 Tax=Psophocarpus tetragonolobus TaxID=3891 RepID=A0AAN9XKD6_PSOTE
MAMLLLIPLLVSSIALFSISSATFSVQPGICYGQLGDNLPPPQISIALINSLNAKRVKLYDANPEILHALRNTRLQVSIMVPNELIAAVAANQTLSDEWVAANVSPFLPDTLIRYILVGNELISAAPNATWHHLVPAMRRIKRSLKTLRIPKIKVGTSSAMDVLQTSFPPSNAAFRNDLVGPIMKPMLTFLNRTKSFFFLDVYPYLAWASDPININLDYALFEPTNVTVTDPGSGLLYTNLFDQMVDAVYFAMEKLGFTGVRIFIAETGWPNGGDIDQIGTNIYNAATYNRNFIKKMTRKPWLGTPARPGSILPSFLFSLFNENQKPGPGTERHFGLLHPNGSRVYDVDLAGVTPEAEFRPLPAPENNEKFKGRIWCVAARGDNATALAAALSYACSQGNGTCDPIQPRGKCFRPDSVLWHSSYAFSSYWAQFRKIGATCYFNGLATQTAKDPSFGSCKFPSVTL